MAKKLSKGGGLSSWSSTGLRAIVMQYLLTYMLPSVKKEIPQGPLREMKTTATAVDMIVSGHVEEAADLLVQRFRALEMALKDGSWKVAKHLELLEDEDGSTGISLREVATKEAVREGNLRKHIERGRGDDRSRSRNR